MRKIASNLAAHFAGGATTLCHCWKVIRQDGTIMGFTDHDCDLMVNGVTYLANTGLDGTKIDHALGLSVGGMEVNGALTADGLLADDLINGKYDNATIEYWLVNWADVTQTLLLDLGSVGQIKRGEYAFMAEMRGLAHLFDQETGRIFQKTCSANFGDAKCGVSLAGATYTASDTILTTDGATLLTTSLAAYSSGWFSNGKLTFTSGANAGSTVTIKSDTLANGVHTIELWMPLAAPLAVGDALSVVAGCDKTFDTCRTQFANVTNFRGFPHMPGNDLVFSYVSSSDTNLDGGSMNIGES